MDGRRFSGPRSQTVRVTVGPQHVSEATLTVVAVTRADVVCNPGEVAFGTVTRGRAASATFDVEYAGPLAWKVTEATVPKGSPFTATVEEMFRGPGLVGYRVTVTLRRYTVPGEFRKMNLLKTNERDGALLPVFVSGKIQRPPADP
jgi:hypothetical protein